MLPDAAIQKTSLIDFPGRVSSVFFTGGCNFRCPYCHNPELVDCRDREALRSPGELLEFLGRRRDVVTGVVISGGEPLLHEGVPELAAAVRGQGLAVKLDTNGSFPDRIAPVRPDYVALDIKTSLPRYRELWPGAPPDADRRILASMGIARSLGVPFEFRVTCVPGVFGPDDARELLPVLRRDDRMVLQGFNPKVTLDPSYGSIPPYTDAEMDSIRAVLSEAVAQVHIRGRMLESLGRRCVGADSAGASRVPAGALGTGSRGGTIR